MRNNSLWRKCYQLRALKVLLMYLFVTPLINKISCSDNQQFLFNILKSKNKGDFLTGSIFCTFELKSIIQKWLSQDALSKVHLNKYGSYFKFILLLSDEIKLNSGPTTLTRNDRLRGLFPSSTAVFLMSGWIISLIQFLRFTMIYGICFKKGYALHLLKCK